MRFSRLVAALAGLLAVPLLASAQGALPSRISGYWAWPEKNVSRPFALSDIQTTSSGVATAKLTWVTVDSKCALSEVPIQLRITGAGVAIAFDARTNCDVSFAAEIVKTAGGWKGTALSAQVPTIFIEGQ